VVIVPDEERYARHWYEARVRLVAQGRLVWHSISCACADCLASDYAACYYSVAFPNTEIVGLALKMRAA
jgi:hypothetical protein